MRWRIVLVGFALAAACSAAGATEFRAGRDASVGAGEVVDDDVFATGSRVVISGHVTGDVVAAGEVVRVTGIVDGSVMAAGREVVVSGEVGGSTRAAGQRVTVSGPVGRNVTVAGAEVVVVESAEVGRDLHAAGGTVVVEGTVRGRAEMRGPNVEVGAKVGKGLYVEGRRIVLRPGARVEGDVAYRSETEISVDPAAAVGGMVTRLPQREGGEGASLVWRAMMFLMVLLFGLVGIAAAPRVFVGAANAMGDRWWYNLLLGLGMLVGAPVAGVLLSVTIIGLPLGIVMLFVWGLALVFSGVPVAVFVGRWLMGRRGARSPYLGLLVGLVAVALVASLPYVAAMARLAIALLGMGVYARALKGAVVEMRRAAA